MSELGIAELDLQGAELIKFLTDSPSEYILIFILIELRRIANVLGGPTHERD